jgi:nicotinamide-nucleotide amidase
MCFINGKLPDKISNMLKNQKLVIATAESCTGGLISHTLTNISGSSEYFDRGIITYSNRAKMELLDVPEDILKNYGAVSMEVAKSMAKGVRIKSNVDIGISTTGIAGPTGGSKEKPVGLVFIAISTENNTFVKKFNFSGNRLQNKKSTCDAALDMLLYVLTR